MFEVKEKPRLVEKAFLISCIDTENDRPEADSLLDELDELTRNLEINVVGREVVRVRKTSPRFILGKGKADEILEQLKELGADVLIFDNEISPAQQRNWGLPTLVEEFGCDSSQPSNLVTDIVVVEAGVTPCHKKNFLGWYGPYAYFNWLALAMQRRIVAFLD